MERQTKPTLAEGAKARLFEHLLRRLDDAARAQELSKQALRMVRSVMDDPFSAEVAAATARVREASARVEELGAGTRSRARRRPGAYTGLT